MKQIVRIIFSCFSAIFLCGNVAHSQTQPELVDLMRPGAGNWCYDPVGELSDTLRADFVEMVVRLAVRAQNEYGLPGTVLAAMAIQESGYGRTRLAILSNNLLSFKYPRVKDWQFGRPSFTLWCQPGYDVGNRYVLFGSKDAAFDYVARVLSQRDDIGYAAVTAEYQRSIKSGVDAQTASLTWLKKIASIYTADENYVSNVTRFINKPLGDKTTDNLWALIAAGL